MEFPHLLRLMEENQFDTIYHEHFSYFSFLTVERVFAAHGLTSSTSRSCRRTAARSGSTRATPRTAREPVESSGRGPCAPARRRPASPGSTGIVSFTEQVHETKRRLLEFLIGARRRGKPSPATARPGKGNTLLNYCGIRTDFLDYTVDRNPYKHGKFLPGTHIPIFAPERICARRGRTTS